DVADLRGGQQKDHRHDDAAYGEDRPIALEYFGTVGEEHHRPVTRAEPELAERVRNAMRHRLLLHVGPLAPLERQRDVLAEALDVLVAEAGQIHGRDLTRSR